jgi:lipopolysaccharide transport system ATP-binding protein
MSDVAIRVDGLGKQYRLGGSKEKYSTLGDQFRKWTSPRQLMRWAARTDRPKFWALKDVSFEVKRGEVIGVIGRNGAGKSTLLKILSQITEPTEGGADIHGRVGSLLEVGTGFHPELTGRENVYLNGAILGMGRAEIARNFKEIVAFAEVEKFIDTPVKHYSSGMYTRLAFAVAAHLEPEILIVDEVLAVGDVEFQKKCLGKMGDVARGGRTVLFVSHNMDSIQRLCSRVVWLADGRLKEDGVASIVVERYLIQPRPSAVCIPLQDHPRPDRVLLRGVNLTQLVAAENSISPWMYQFGQTIAFGLNISTTRRLKALRVFYAIFSQSGFEIASGNGLIQVPLSEGEYPLKLTIPHLRLAPGSYGLSLGLKSEYGDEDHVTEPVNIEIIPNELSASENVDRIRAACVHMATAELIR